MHINRNRAVKFLECDQLLVQWCVKLTLVKAVGSNERIRKPLWPILKYNSSISKIGVAFRFSSWMHFLLLTFSILKSEFTLVPTLFEGYSSFCTKESGVVSLQ